MADEDPVLVWTAERRTALVLEILKGTTSPVEADRKHVLPVAEVEEWQNRSVLLCEERIVTGFCAVRWLHCHQESSRIGSHSTTRAGRINHWIPAALWSTVNNCNSWFESRSHYPGASAAGVIQHQLDQKQPLGGERAKSEGRKP